jgi:protein-S-isoprenylcysteine O-methyltransferase Ste14
MYLALLLYSLGQALVLPNWVAGPAYGVVFSILLALRLGREERMMLDRFGRDYEAYMARTRRLLPGVW